MKRVFCLLSFFSSLMVYYGSLFSNYISVGLFSGYFFTED